jgi:hypothetical protein
MRRNLLIWPLGLAWLVAGCAATVKKPDGGAPAPAVIKATGKVVALNVTGSDAMKSSKYWATLKRVWNLECTEEFHEADAQFSMPDESAQPTGSQGALIVANIVDYRYVSSGARIGLGVMTGNAYINAHVEYHDLKTGETWATKTYDTKSSAWGGIFAAMTRRQVRAICHEMLGEVSAH